MSQTQNNEEVVGERPTNEEIFYADYGDQLIKETLPFLNQVLRQFVALAGSFLGIMLAFYDKKFVNVYFALFTILALLVCLGAATFGIMPHTAPFHRRDPYQIRECVRAGISKKRACAYLCGFTFFLALACLSLGFFVNVFGK